MDRKRLILFGTRHWRKSDIPPVIRAAFESLIRKFHPDVALEEWSITQTEKSGLADLCDSVLPWESIGTPPEPEFKTYDRNDAADFPTAEVPRYGPLAIQEMREKVMCENILQAMSSRNVAVVVLGLAHLHSMMMKLSKDFEVRGYSYLGELY